jgi:hypothetical protein
MDETVHESIDEQTGLKVYQIPGEGRLLMTNGSELDASDLIDLEPWKGFPDGVPNSSNPVHFSIDEQDYTIVEYTYAKGFRPFGIYNRTTLYYGRGYLYLHYKEGDEIMEEYMEQFPDEEINFELEIPLAMFSPDFEKHEDEYREYAIFKTTDQNTHFVPPSNTELGKILDNLSKMGIEIEGDVKAKRISAENGQRYKLLLPYFQRMDEGFK